MVNKKAIDASILINLLFLFSYLFSGVASFRATLKRVYSVEQVERALPRLLQVRHCMQYYYYYCCSYYSYSYSYYSSYYYYYYI